MTESPNMETTYIAEAQANAFVSINDFINRFDALTHIAIIDRDLTAPPGGESNGDVYLVAAGPSGAWTNNAGDLAMYYDGWVFQSLTAGMTVWIIDEEEFFIYDGVNFVHPSPPHGAIRNLQLSYTDAETVTIAAGSATDDDNTHQMELSGPQSVDLSASGVNGLDTGAEGADTWYYIFLIRNPATDTVSGLISESPVSPTMPAGYTQKRRIGVARNDGGSDFLKFDQRGCVRCRRYWYDEEDSVIEALTDGSAVTFTDIPLSALVPPVSDNVALHCEFSTGTTPGVAGDEVLLRPNGSSVSAPGWKITGLITSDTLYTARYLEIPTDSSQIIEYNCTRNANDLTVRVLGYDDEV